MQTAIRKIPGKVLDDEISKMYPSILTLGSNCISRLHYILTMIDKEV